MTSVFDIDPDETRRRVVVQMHKRGASVSTIAKATGLPVAMVRKILAEVKP